MTIPNLLIIGAPKSASSSLYRYLGQHPEIFMSANKEPGFLVPWTLEHTQPINLFYKRILDWKEYQELFAGAAGYPVRGEASVRYMIDAGAIGSIKHYLGTPKLIAILRSPAERAFSHYLMQVRIGEVKRDFRATIEMEPRTPVTNLAVTDQHVIVRTGFYAAHLRRFFESFPERNIHICLTEDLVSDPGAFLCKIFRFLGVDDTMQIDTRKQYNQTVAPRFLRLHRLMERPNALRNAWQRHYGRFPRLVRLKRKIQYHNRRPVPQLSPDDRSYLIDVYREDILRLQDLIGQDLTHWLDQT